MRGLLQRVVTGRALGLYVSDREVALAVVKSTPGGPAEEAVEVYSTLSEPADQVLERALAPRLRRGRSRQARLPVTAAVPDIRLFHAARALTAANRSAPPAAWLDETLRTPGAFGAEVSAALLKLDVGKRPVGVVAACRGEDVAQVLGAVGRFSGRLIGAEPAPFSLWRAGERAQKVPRGSRLAARVFLAGDRGLAVLGPAGRPFLWRSFGLNVGGEGAAVLGALANLRVLAAACQVDAPVDALIVHGRPELAERLEADLPAAKTGAKLALAGGPALGPAGIALGAAMAGLEENDDRLDLARDVKPSPTVGEIFPWADAALQLAALVGVSLFEAGAARSLAHESAARGADLSKFPWLKNLQAQDLEKEAKATELRNKAVKDFLETRVSWSSHVLEIADRLPETTTLTDIQGAAELEGAGAKGGAAAKGKKSLVMKLAAPIPESGVMPADIDGFLETLRNHESLRRDFPLVEMSQLKSGATQKNEGAVATFSVVCLPKADAPAKPAAKPEAK